MTDPSTTPPQKRKCPQPEQLNEYEQWYAEGSDVAEMAYHGGGFYEARPVTVTRVTKAMIFTSSGRRFWRKSMFQVGQQDAVYWAMYPDVPKWRIVPTTNPHAAPLLAEQAAALPEARQNPQPADPTTTTENP